MPSTGRLLLLPLPTAKVLGRVAAMRATSVPPATPTSIIISVMLSHVCVARSVWRGSASIRGRSVRPLALGRHGSSQDWSRGSLDHWRMGDSNRQREKKSRARYLEGCMV